MKYKCIWKYENIKGEFTFRSSPSQSKAKAQKILKGKAGFFSIDGDISYRVTWLFPWDEILLLAGVALFAFGFYSSFHPYDYIATFVGGVFLGRTLPQISWIGKY
jgi:hypothetical protein